MKPYKVSPEQLTGIYEAIKKREVIPDQYEILGEANRRAAEMYKKTPPWGSRQPSAKRHKDLEQREQLRDQLIAQLLLEHHIIDKKGTVLR